VQPVPRRALYRAGARLCYHRGKPEAGVKRMEPAMMMRALAVILAALGGWILGRTTPHWAEDRHREYSPHTAMEQYFNVPTDYTGQHRGCLGGVGQDASGVQTGWCTGIWLPIVLILGAVVLAFYFWYEGPKEHRTDRINFLVDPSHWIVLGSAAAGYVVSVVLKGIGRR